MKPETSLKAQKASLRKDLRARRKSLDAQKKQAMDRAIRHELTGLIAERQAHTVAAFWPFDGEPDLLPLLNLLEREGVTLALPVVQPTPGRPQMAFHLWSSITPMENSAYGIPEPVGTAEIPLFDIGVLLLPLVGWDKNGGRLGMGAGYYDRAMQPFGQSASPLRVGVAYQLQELATVPSEPWDVSLHLVVTESGRIRCAG